MMKLGLSILGGHLFGHLHEPVHLVSPASNLPTILDFKAGLREPPLGFII
jgi:hypothetical protein